jgi:hypothetical protein
VIAGRVAGAAAAVDQQHSCGCRGLERSPSTLRVPASPGKLVGAATSEACGRPRCAGAGVCVCPGEHGGERLGSRHARRTVRNDTQRHRRVSLPRVSSSYLQEQTQAAPVPVGDEHPLLPMSGQLTSGWRGELRLAAWIEPRMPGDTALRQHTPRSTPRPRSVRNRRPVGPAITAQGSDQQVRHRCPWLAPQLAIATDRLAQSCGQRREAITTF